MAENGIEIFSTKAADIQMPSAINPLDEGLTEEEIKEQIKKKSIISDGIEKAILGETVKSVMLPEETSLIQPNFIIDVSKIQLYKHQEFAIGYLLHPDGDTALYLNGVHGMGKLGYGDGETLERVIPLMVEHVFHGEIKAYKNFEPGKPLVEVSNKDISAMRLSI